MGRDVVGEKSVLHPLLQPEHPERNSAAVDAGLVAQLRDVLLRDFRAALDGREYATDQVDGRGHARPRRGRPNDPSSGRSTAGLHGPGATRIRGGNDCGKDLAQKEAQEGGYWPSAADDSRGCILFNLPDAFIHARGAAGTVGSLPPKSTIC